MSRNGGHRRTPVGGAAKYSATAEGGPRFLGGEKFFQTTLPELQRIDCRTTLVANAIFGDRSRKSFLNNTLLPSNSHPRTGRGDRYRVWRPIRFRVIRLPRTSTSQPRRPLQTIDRILTLTHVSFASPPSGRADEVSRTSSALLFCVELKAHAHRGFQSASPPFHCFPVLLLTLGSTAHIRVYCSH